MQDIILYHNPRCSKSRETLAILREHHIEPVIIEYLETPPSQQELKKIVKLLDMDPRELMRKKESAYKTEKLDNPTLTDDQLIAAMAKNPILIERPIVIAGNKAVIGRPPENVLEII